MRNTTNAALGSSFFHVLSGRVPFQGSSPTAILMQVTNEEAPRLDEVAADVPTPLGLIIKRMMARRREERYQDVGVILEDLTSYQRRGLLEFSASGPFVPPRRPPQPSKLGEETELYQPSPEG